MDEPNPATGPVSAPEWYRIRIQGRLERRWSVSFDGMALTPGEDATTIMRGPVRDQAALHGLIQRVRDLGLTLVEVTLEEPEQAGEHES